MPELSSRIPEFYRRSIRERLSILFETVVLSDDARAHFVAGGGLASDVADRMSENVIASHGLPFGVGLNFRVNHRDVLVPMVV